MPELLTEEQILAILQACVRALQRTAAAVEQQRLEAGLEGLTQALEEQARIGERIAAAVERLAER